MLKDIKAIADNADLIVNGYAYTKDNDIIRVIDLNHPEDAPIDVLEMEAEKR